jgi:hypothetical protein
MSKFKNRRQALAWSFIAMAGLGASLAVAGEGYQGSGAVGEKEIQREIKDEAARLSLAPHSIMLETELMTALDQVRGLKAQVKTAQSQPNPEFVEHYREHRREIGDSVKSAKSHESEIRSRAVRFPSVATSEQYKSLSPALGELERLNQQWDKQATVRSYWNDPARVTSDLDQLERRLSTAIEKARSFNARLDVSEIG